MVAADAGFLFLLVMKRGLTLVLGGEGAIGLDWIADPRNEKRKKKPKSLPVSSLFIIKLTIDTFTTSFPYRVLKKQEADDDWEEVCMQARVDDVFSLLSSVLF